MTDDQLHNPDLSRGLGTSRHPNASDYFRVHRLPESRTMISPVPATTSA